MAITLKANLWTHKKNKAGLCPIAISIRGGGEETYFQTEYKTTKECWVNGQVAKGYKNYDVINASIEKMITGAERFILTKELADETVDIYVVKDYFDPDKASSADFFLYAEALIKDDKKSTKKRYEVEINKIREFVHGRKIEDAALRERVYAKMKLPFSKITHDWLDKYRVHLLKFNTSNTTINAFKVIRKACRHAYKSRVIRTYVFEQWDYPTYKKPKKGPLMMDQCEELFKLLERKDIVPALKKVIAFFLLECFAGLRVSDWGKYKDEQLLSHMQDLTITTTKTDTDVRLPVDLMPSLARILVYIREHKLVWTETGEHANDMLKIIGPLAGIEMKLTTHVARHTFASMCFAIGLSEEAIALAMGITVKQVRTYVHATGARLRKELERLGGGV
jgi:site-specific recombinase XerD